MSTRSHTYVTRGPVIMGALQPRIEEEDGPNDAQISQALTLCRSAGSAFLRAAMAVGGEWSVDALRGLGLREAEGVLWVLGVDPDDAPAEVLGALADEFVSAYLAC